MLCDDMAARYAEAERAGDKRRRRPRGGGDKESDIEWPEVGAGPRLGPDEPGRPPPGLARCTPRRPSRYQAPRPSALEQRARRRPSSLMIVLYHDNEDVQRGAQFLREIFTLRRRRGLDAVSGS